MFAQAHRALLVEALASWTVVRPHPHAGSDAFTVIEPRSATTESGGDGFSYGAVAPHTDRALLSRPPALAAVLVDQPAQAGGRSLLVDLRADWWFRVLARSSRVESDLRLHAADGSLWPVVEAAHGLVRVRFRDDDLARPRWSGIKGRILLARVQALAARPVAFRLGAGEGYLVHNHRLLHGRTAFQGYRRVMRLLADVRPEHRYGWLNDGFALNGQCS